MEAAWLTPGGPENAHLAHERIVFAAPGTPPVRGLGTIRVKNGPRGADGAISCPTLGEG